MGQDSALSLEVSRVMATCIAATMSDLCPFEIGCRQLTSRETALSTRQNFDVLCGRCLLNQVCRRSVFALQAGCANSRWSIQMPPKKANKGAFGKGNQGYGLRTEAVDADDEPDAAGPEAPG